MHYSTAKPIRINGRTAASYAARGINFTNSNGQLYGRWETPFLYVVYSYGPHWPLFIYCADTGCWYANEDKYSRTTTKHYGSARPYTVKPVHHRSYTWMREAVSKGTAFILLSHCDAREAA